VTGLPLASAFVRIRPEGALFKSEADSIISGGLMGGGAKLAIAGVTALIVGAGLAATKLAANYQTATTLLVTGAGESEKSIGLVRDGLLAMAPAVGMGPIALAKAMFMVESAGFHGAAGLLVMKAAAEGAKIGGADATVVADGLTTALVDYHLPASQAAEVTSKLVAVVAAGKTNMGDLTGSLSTILPYASSFGVSLNDIGGAMATMTGEGLHADVAATALRFTMMSMANETPKGLKALASIGMTAQQLKDDLSTQGVGGALQTVTDMVGKKFPAGSTEYIHAIAAIVGGTRGMTSELSLTGSHAATLTANIKSVAKATTEADGSVKGWGLTQADLNFQIDRAKGLFSELTIKIGNALLPAFTAALSGFNNFVGGIQESYNKGGVSRIFTDLGAKITAALPGIKVKLAQWGVALWSWVKDSIPLMLVQLGGLLLKLGTWAYTVAYPAIGVALVKWGKSFVEWIQPMIPLFLLQMQVLLTKFGTWLNGTALPWLGIMLAQWANAFIAWIQPMISPFLTKMGQLLGALGSWLLNTGLPWIVSHLAQWAWAFVKWVGPAIIPMVGALMDLAGKLTWWVVAVALPAIVAKLAGWGQAFLGWVAGAAVGLLGKLGGLLGSIIGWAAGVPGRILGALGDLGSTLLKAGSSLMGGLLQGIKDNFGNVASFVGSIASTIAGLKGPLSYDRTLLIPHGNAIMAGLNEGLMSGFGKVKSNVAGMGGQLNVGSLDFATKGARSAAVAGAGAGTGGGSGDLLAEVQGLRADIRALPKSYQMGSRQMAGA
jgi:TP901 family phage tail tape measure protein